MLDSFIRFIINSNNLLTVLSVIIAIIALVYAIYTKRHPDKPKPVYQDRFFRLIDIGEHDPEYNLSLKYYDRTIPRLTNYIMVILNDGKDTLLGDHIPDDDPLVVEFEEGSEVLRVKVKETNDTINFEPVMKGNIVTLYFNYMEPNQGVRLEILHTGKIPNPKIRGSIRGIPEGLIYLGPILLEESTATLTSSSARPLEKALKFQKDTFGIFAMSAVITGIIFYYNLTGYNWLWGWVLFFIFFIVTFNAGKDLWKSWKSRHLYQLLTSMQK